MKLVRKVRSPSLWAWLKVKLPRGLVPCAVDVGYGQVCGIYLTGTAPGFIGRLFGAAGDPAAIVSGGDVELFQPQYISDFEDLLRAFERETGRTTTLSYWEAPVPAELGSSE